MLSGYVGCFDGQGAVGCLILKSIDTSCNVLYSSSVPLAGDDGGSIFLYMIYIAIGMIYYLKDEI